ncbi:MAG TPA: hypothetical protein VGR07_19630 [Thermoanaerobaculia bacterium]|nr:hypothetical protein [Thermoanaerobaculia bacterium]
MGADVGEMSPEARGRIRERAERLVTSIAEGMGVRRPTDLDAFRGMLERAGEKPRVQRFEDINDEEGSFIVIDVRGTDGMCWKFDRDGKFVGYQVWGD